MMLADIDVRRRIGTISYSEVFLGVFVITNSNINIDTFIRISSRETINIEKNKSIEISNKEFDEYFKVYSDNENLMKQVITYDFMQFLIDFYKKTKLGFEIMLKDNITY